MVLITFINMSLVYKYWSGISSKGTITAFLQVRNHILVVITNPQNHHHEPKPFPSVLLIEDTHLPTQYAWRARESCLKHAVDSKCFIDISLLNNPLVKPHPFSPTNSTCNIHSLKITHSLILVSCKGQK